MDWCGDVALCVMIFSTYRFSEGCQPLCFMFHNGLGSRRFLPPLAVFRGGIWPVWLSGLGAVQRFMMTRRNTNFGVLVRCDWVQTVKRCF